MHSATVVADSINPDGIRLTSMVVTLPRIVLAEFNTHRMFSRNSASSRAIPVEKMIRMVEENPFVPSHWGKNQKGMQAEEEFHPVMHPHFKGVWLDARDAVVKQAKRLLQDGVHKQITNRLLEPFMWHTVLVTATEWSNYFNLRCHPAAHPEIRLAAEAMRNAMKASKPQEKMHGEWHMPFIDWEDLDYNNAANHDIANLGEMIEVSIGRCARVSYLTHDGKRDPREDVNLHDRLLKMGHLSPFEHVARPMTEGEYDAYSTHVDVDAGRVPFCGNFRGWVQRRKEISNEADILA